jgi:hypothetical protein
MPLVGHKENKKSKNSQEREMKIKIERTENSLSLMHLSSWLLFLEGESILS